MIQHSVVLTDDDQYKEANDNIFGVIASVLCFGCIVDIL